MYIDPRTPVLVGVAQSVDRASAPGKGQSPQDMMAAVAREAIADSCGAGILELVDCLAVVRLFQDSGFGAPFGTSNNFPASVAKRIGANPRRMLYSPVGGEVPQHLVNIFAEEIAAGRHDVVLLAGCEPIRTQSLAHRSGMELDWSEEFNTDAEKLVGFKPASGPEMLSKSPDSGTMSESRMVSRHELIHGFGLPAHVYPMFENALGAHYGRSPMAHRQAIGELMARFAAIAEKNPYSQLPISRTVEELITPTEQNRYIGYPYTKFLNSNMFVDQAASILLMSTRSADRAGVPSSRRVYLHGSADIHDKLYVSQRVNYHSSPAIRLGAGHTFSSAGISPDDLDHIDLYSCFSAAVEISADEIGLSHDDARGLTLTGGLPYFGGPGNNYAMHSIAEVAARCRARPGSWGFNYANGGFLTKHSFGIWNTRPKQFERVHPDTYQSEIDKMVTPPLTEKPCGTGKIEAFTVVYDKGSPLFAIIIGRLSVDGSRFLAKVYTDLGDLIDIPAIHRPVSVHSTEAENIATLA